MTIPTETIERIVESVSNHICMLVDCEDGKGGCTCKRLSRAALSAALPLIVEECAKMMEQIAAKKNEAQTKALEAGDDFAAGLFQASKSTARAGASAIRSLAAKEG